jgi:hypothetical protein
MMRIVIKASDVAAIVGRNPYKPTSEVRADMWKKYWPETFTGQTKNDRAESVFQTARAKIEVDENLTTEQKTEVIEHIRSRVYTGHGTRSEDRTSDKMVVEENVTLKKDNSFYRISICEIGELDFEIVGKIDRIQEDPDGSKTLVEIKNRTRRLFKKVPEYEYIQVQTYLQMLNLERARLVEQFNSQIMSHDIARDDVFWKEIIQSLESFCQELYRAAV